MYIHTFYLCLHPSSEHSSGSGHAGTASQQLMYSAPISALAAEDMTALIICAMVWIAPLLAGDGVLSDMKKCPPARLRALVSDKE